MGSRLRVHPTHAGGSVARANSIVPSPRNRYLNRPPSRESTRRTPPRESSSAATMMRSPTIPTGRTRFIPFAWGVFIYSMLVILWGYFLRISESGDGCGTDWPLCHGAMVPAGHTFPTWVEFVHRATSGVVLLLVIAMAIWAFRAFPRGHAVRLGAALALLFTITESLFGAVLVIFGWVATDISTARILLRPFHVTNTFLLMGALALTPFWATRRMSRAPRLRAASTRLLWPALIGSLALGWTGSWTGLAATAFPAGSVADGIGQYVTGEHLLIYLRIIHPVLAVAVVAILIRWSRRIRSAHPSSQLIRGVALGVAILAVVQLVLGPVTVLLLNPVGTRLLHLFLADLIWVGLLFGWAEAGWREAGAEAYSWTKEVSESRLRTKAASN
ncbi:MAG: heme A synthase [Gemmatimonadales bacterium]|nr:MAG: heme A synthase [Gemmatimonadales bacterium]